MSYLRSKSLYSLTARRNRSFDTDKLIREVVYVEAAVDSDHDGKLDLLKVEIIRYKDTEHGIKVPVLYTASPYNQGTNDSLGAKMLHPATAKLTHKTPTTTSYTDIKFEAKAPNLPPKREVAGRSTRAEETFDRELSYTLNDYFLARGFGVVYLLQGSERAIQKAFVLVARKKKLAQRLPSSSG